MPCRATWIRGASIEEVASVRVPVISPGSTGWNFTSTSLLPPGTTASGGTSTSNGSLTIRSWTESSICPVLLMVMGITFT